MFLSVFDIFKIGIGPSSSHTMGPMTAAVAFLDRVSNGDNDAFDPQEVSRIIASLHGSLAFTGKGHATDRAVMLGLLGFRPDAVDADLAEQRLADLHQSARLAVAKCGEVAFDPDKDLVFDYGPALPLHANGMKLTALDTAGEPLLSETYYSIGGGFIMTEAELIASEKGPDSDLHEEQEAVGYPYPFGSAAEMLQMGKASDLTIAEMKRANEESVIGADALTMRLDAIWKVMDNCIERGLTQEGILPGGLSVKRRARAIHQRLLDQSGSNSRQPHTVNDWLSVYAMAVNEENAAGGQVVTSPTNGAAGVVPAVIRYYRDHCIDCTREGIDTFLLTAAAIGGLIKHNASISGAECGCQAEVGSASAMAAAGLCAALGGSNEQVENAAEIALEHHLGMTCDPVRGLVQVPCIERNGMGAIKAVSAASLALHGDGAHFMPLDNCIETMRQTGQDMRDKYKETSLGGLAVNLPEC
ncbi:MAG: L-serine ammonia-lyase [Roseibium sp.]|uniref:L-serine ammonia-lyase n=1 Tax=Roseibium sp. TaxID=1936156 RepID=UPI001B1BED02|nr:L-serine ammonia-lyase [Roseibium sp.]MBO6893986.1 L-serine ammonia-lyase [Roseibium sp.]MBO6930749.1 L-serine ammonia-lyase [Roseibium sp.]